jgi:hypothetical protein
MISDDHRTCIRRIVQSPSDGRAGLTRFAYRFPEAACQYLLSQTVSSNLLKTWRQWSIQGRRQNQTASSCLQNRFAALLITGPECPDRPRNILCCPIKPADRARFPIFRKPDVNTQN